MKSKSSDKTRLLFIMLKTFIARMECDYIIYFSDSRLLIKVTQEFRAKSM